MNDAFLAFACVAAGIIHLLAAAAVLSRARIEALYGIQVRTPELELLLRHRALLFAVLAALLLAAAWRQELRLIAGVAGLVSMLGYVQLLWLSATSSPSLVRVAWVDLAASALLSLGLVMHLARAGK